MQDVQKKELIKVSETKFGTKVVSARELYDFLQVSERFSRFMERNMEYGFILGTDYTPYQMVHPSNNQKYTDYALTLDTAKEIAMIQRTPQGKEARQYFIEVEKRFIEGQKQLTGLELLAQQVQYAIEQERRMSVVENRMDELEAKTSTIPTGFLTVSGYAARNKIKISISEAAKIGRLASRKCLELGYTTGSVHDEKFSSVKSYPIEVLQMIFQDRSVAAYC